MSNLYRRGLRLEYFTIGYNFLEAIASIGFGFLASSIALIGFGLDSVVESLSGFVLIWRLKKHGRVSKETEERIERKATRLVAITFLILGVYVLYESVNKLIYKKVPDTSLPGVIIAALSLIIMPILAWLKYDTGRSIGSKALMADSKETLACAVLSLTLLLGLGLNHLVGFWQADPIAGIIIFLFLWREGVEIWGESKEERGEKEETEG